MTKHSDSPVTGKYPDPAWSCRNDNSRRAVLDF